MSDAHGAPADPREEALSVLVGLWLDLRNLDVLEDPERLSAIAAQAGAVREGASGALRLESGAIASFAAEAIEANELGLDQAHALLLARRAETRALLLGGKVDGKRVLNVDVVRMTPRGLARPANNWRRLSAYVMDALIVVAGVIAGLLVVGVVMAVANPDGVEEMSDSTLGLIVLALIFGLTFLYGTLLESSPMQATVGKKLLGQMVTDGEGNRISIGRAAGRNGVKLLQLVVFWPLLYMAVFFSDLRQGLHDMAARTLVLETA